MDALIKSSKDLLAVVKLSDKMADEVYPEDIADIVKLHAKIATGAAFIPVPGVDLVVSASSIWSMYGRINGKLGVSIKENILKTLVSGVLTNLAGYGMAVGIGSGLKLIPGIGTILGTTIMLAGAYATCLLSGWVYIRVLTILANENNGIVDFSNLGETLNSFIKNNKGEIREMFTNAKEYYNQNKSKMKLSEEEKEELNDNIKRYKENK